MRRVFLTIVLCSIAIALIGVSPASARTPQKAKKPHSCESHAKQIISAQYGEGGMKLHRILGPFRWNESFFDAKGNPGIRHRIAFAVAYGWDREFRKGNKPGTDLLIGECIEGDPSKLRDRNGDQALDLNDFIRAKR
ncbi:MAG: hypothetical protein JRH20_18090 [Deltaproteobacteria bacterium]|nr:hypothetical protein [Deltaproteobacteria bacterium]